MLKCRQALLGVMLTFITTTQPCVSWADDWSRTLSLTVAVDPAFRAQPNWEASIKRAIDTVSSIYQRKFGISLVLAEIQPWEPYVPDSDSTKLLINLEKDIPHRKGEILVAIYDRKCLDHYAGLASIFGSRLLLLSACLRQPTARANLELVLSHEIAHLFGAFHPRSHIRSVMSGDDADIFDDQTDRVIRLMRDRDFSKDGLIALDLDESQKQVLDSIYKEGHRFGEKHPLAIGYTMAGITLGHQGKFQEGIDALEKAISYDGKLAYPHASLADIYLRQGSYDKAMLSLQHAFAIDPSSAEARSVSAIAKAGRNGHAAATKEFEEANKSGPASAIGSYNLGLNYLQQGRVADAERLLRESIRIDPRMVAAYSDLAIAQGMQGKLRESEQTLREAIRLDGKHQQAHANLGYTLAQMGKWPEAIAEYQIALSLNPGDTRTKANLSQAMKRVQDRM